MLTEKQRNGFHGETMEEVNSMHAEHSVHRGREEAQTTSHWLAITSTRKETVIWPSISQGYFEFKPEVVIETRKI